MVERFRLRVVAALDSVLVQVARLPDRVDAALVRAVLVDRDPTRDRVARTRQLLGRAGLDRRDRRRRPGLAAVGADLDPDVREAEVVVLVVEVGVRGGLVGAAEGGRRVGHEPGPVDLQRLAAGGRLPRPRAAVERRGVTDLDRALGTRRPTLAEVAPEDGVVSTRVGLRLLNGIRERAARDGHVADVAGTDDALRRRRVGIAEIGEMGSILRLGDVRAVLAALPGDVSGAGLVDRYLRLVLAVRALGAVGAHARRERRAWRRTACRRAERRPDRECPEQRADRRDWKDAPGFRAAHGTGVAQAAGGASAVPPVWFATCTNVSPAASCCFVLPP